MLKLTSLACVSFLLVASFSAMADQATIRDIVNLSRTIRQTAPVTAASDADQLQVRQLLSDALDILNPTTKPLNAVCVQVAYAVYFQTLYAVQATDKAVALCKNVVDMDVLNYLYPIYFGQFNASQAMDKAGAGAGRSSAGKLDLIKYAYNVYFVQLNGAAAADAALKGVANVPAGSLACVDQLFKNYFQSLKVGPALDKALAGCSR